MAHSHRYMDRPMETGRQADREHVLRHSRETSIVGHVRVMAESWMEPPGGLDTQEWRTVDT